MESRVANYISAANQNEEIERMDVGGVNMGFCYMRALDHILEVHPRKFNVDKLDRLIQKIMSGPLSKGVLPDIRLAMKLYED